MLPVADQEKVDELRHGLRVEDRRPAGAHQGRRLISIHRTHRYAPEIEHLQHRRIAQLVLQGEAEQIELPEGRAALQGGEQHTMTTQQIAHVEPRGEDPLGGDPVAFVEDVVQDLEADVAHPQLVDVREAQADAQLRVHLDGGVDLAADVPSGFLDAFDESLEPLPLGMHVDPLTAVDFATRHARVWPG